MTHPSIRTLSSLFALSLPLLVIGACDAMSQPTPTVATRARGGEHPTPGPADSCARLLFADGDHEAGRDRLFAVSALDCADPQDGVVLVVGPVSPSDAAADAADESSVYGADVLVIGLPQVGPDACVVVAGPGPDDVHTKIDGYHPICPADGNWPAYRVTLLAADGEVIDSLELPGDLADAGESWPTPAAHRDAHGTWHAAAPGSYSVSGCVYAKG